MIGSITTIKFWYSILTVFKIGQLQSEYSPGIITVRIQSETFFVVGIQSQYSRIVSGYEASDMKSHSFCVRMKFLVTSTNYCSRNTVGSNQL